jgi:hypothetical protein
MEKAALQQQMQMDSDVFDKALEKLWGHGGATLDSAENVSVGERQWRQLYIARGEQKRAQIERCSVSPTPISVVAPGEIEVRRQNLSA